MPVKMKKRLGPVEEVRGKKMAALFDTVMIGQVEQVSFLCLVPP